MTGILGGITDGITGGILRLVLVLHGSYLLGWGLLFATAPFTEGFTLLGLPAPQPAYYGQLLGLALLIHAWLAFRATFERKLAIAVGAALGWLNLLGAMLVLAWLLLGMLLGPAARTAALASIVFMLACGLLEVRASSTMRRRDRQQARAAKSAGTPKAGSAASSSYPSPTTDAPPGGTAPSSHA